MKVVALKSSGGRWIMVSAILASSMAFIDSTALNVVLPSLQKSLHATGADLFWILNAYLLMLAALILTGGSVGDKLGRKKMFMTGIFIFIAGSAACGFSGTIVLLILSRLIQGIGGALMIPGSLSLISSSIQEKERGKAIGIWSAATTIVTMGGPIIGGALADAGFWRMIFFVNVPIGIVTLLILGGRVQESRDEDASRKLDAPGAVFIASGLALITFGFLRMPAAGFNNWEVYGSLSAGLFFLLLFLLTERRSGHPMIPLNLFSERTFSGVNLLTFFLYAGLGTGMLFLSLNMVQMQGYSQLNSGLTFLPFTVLMILFAGYAGNLADRYGARLLLITGPAVTGVGLLLLSFVKKTAGPAEYWTTFFPGILVLGLGMSFTVAPLTATVMGSVSDHLSGTASGINNAMTRISGVFANAIIGALAVIFFSGALQMQIGNTTLNPEQKHAVMSEAVNLGDAKVPAVISVSGRQAVKELYRQGFIVAYSRVMQISAALAFLGATMSLLFIRRKKAVAVKR